jgi:hypothetical protein
MTLRFLDKAGIDKHCRDMKPLSKAASWVRFYGGAFFAGVLTMSLVRLLQDHTSWKFLDITAARMVRGNWKGTMKADSGALPEGSLSLMIDDQLHYAFGGQTASQMVVESGSLVMRGGRLIGDTGRWVLTLALYDYRGNAVIFLESTNRETGDRYYGEFMRSS